MEVQDKGFSKLKGAMRLSATEAALVDSFMSKWETLVIKKDLESLPDMFAEKFAFSSPVVYKAYTQDESHIVFAILQSIIELLPDFTYTAFCSGHDKSGQIHLSLTFEGTLTTRDGKRRGVQGCDFITLDGNGRIIDLTVKVRPLGALQELAQIMLKKVEGIIMAKM